MQSIETRRASTLVAAAAVLAALLLYVEFQGLIAGQAIARADSGATLERSPKAGEAETEIARTDLAGRMEAALGGSFAGVWFEPATAQLHVGVTSMASRELAESVAAQAGLAGVVTETPVASTWAQLEAVREAWRHRFVEQVPSGTFAASLVAQDNSVKIQLGSDVPSSSRAELRSDLANAPVDVSLSVVPSKSLRVTPYNRCAKFVKFKAYCDPTIVSGVSIGNEASVSEGNCTAGTPVIRKSPKTEAEATETFLLTAGHCLVGEGAVGKNWFAFKKNGTREKIGKAEAALSYAGSTIDAGLIKIEGKPWAEPTSKTPVKPVIANWKAGEETEPFELIEENTPVEKMLVCYSGQRTGTQCGEIKEAEKLEVVKNEEGKVVVEWAHASVVELEGGKKAGEGDSGAPFFEEEPYKNEFTGHVLGTLVGGTTPGEANRVVFQRLSVQLAGLAEKGFSMELLTPANEKRP
jgi:hypothetical protein